MRRKVFVSYKYADNSVQNRWGYWNHTVRDYVDYLQNLIGQDYINLGEKDGEDLSVFKESTIYSRLKDKIWQSSVTIVLISKNMKAFWANENDQWIPWEISYSLRENSREGTTSLTNGVMAVVLPDESGRYDYYLEEKTCCTAGCRNLKTNHLFSILQNNMFNKQDKDIYPCDREIVYSGNPSYIESVKWDDFIENYNYYIELAIQLRDKKHEYKILKVV